MTTEVEVTYCEKCSEELECGQIGVCDSCRTYKFSELSDRAKDTVRDAHRNDDVDDQWWDGVYEDAVRMGALLGVHIGETWHSSHHKDKPGYKTTNISFSGFCSQGDGASFEGHYLSNPEAVAKVTAETNDAELLRIAERLTLLQVTRRLQGLEPFSATINTAGGYSHSGTMRAEIEFDASDDLDPAEDALENEVTQLMRDFADWIYKNLETEHDYLTSDEHIDEWLEDSDELYDEDGQEI